MRKKRSTPFVKGIDRYEIHNNPSTFFDLLKHHNMIWTENNKYGTLTHVPSNESLTVPVDISTSFAYKRYLVQRLRDKIF